MVFDKFTAGKNLVHVVDGIALFLDLIDAAGAFIDKVCIINKFIKIL